MPCPVTHTPSIPSSHHLITSPPPQHDYYGGEDAASFHLKDMEAWAAAHQQPPPQPPSDASPPAPTVGPVPPTLRVKWPRTRWRNAEKDKQEQQQQQEGTAAAAVAAAQAWEWDPASPAEMATLPLLGPAHSTVRVLHVSSDAEAQQERGPQQATDEEEEQQEPWTLERLRARSREFQLDLCPLVLLAGGDAIDPLLSSGVASYLEFRTLQALFIATAGSGGSGGSDSSDDVAFHRVPCSKTDVFSSRLLPAKEKRQLMRFLQCAADWGFARQSGRAAARRNETELGQGRSLHRPQNKGVVNLDVDAFAGRPFRAFLREGAKVDAHLESVILYALALAPAPATEPALSTEAGLARVFAHLQGLGQYGQTAFLWPIFGAGDVTQAFCRTASVWGATFLLRRQPAQLCLATATAAATDADADGGGGRCLGITLPDKEDADAGSSRDDDDDVIACDHVVLGQAALPGCRPSGRRALRRLAFLDGPPPALRPGVTPPAAPALTATMTGGGGGGGPAYTCHCGGVIPAGVLPLPAGARAGATVHFYCVEPAARCAPDGVYLLHLAALVGEEEQQQQGQGSQERDAQALALMDAATAALLQGESGDNGSSSPPPRVLWSVTYEDPVLLPPPAGMAAAAANVHLVRKEAPEFYLQGALDQAKALFAAICPGEPFLPAEVPEGVLPFDFLRDRGEARDEDEEILDATLFLQRQRLQGAAAETTAAGPTDDGEQQEQHSAPAPAPGEGERA